MPITMLRLERRSGRRFVWPAVVISLSALVPAGCGSSPGREQRASSGPRRPEVCTLREIAWPKPSNGLTFAQLVDLPDGSRAATDVDVVISAAGALRHPDFGTFDPVMRYLAERGAAEGDITGARPAFPRRTAVIEANAQALDRALADGLCD